MKNKIMVILTFLATIGVIGNTFAISLTDTRPFITFGNQSLN